MPSHLSLLDHLVHSLNPGGWLAIQVPGNFEDPHHLAIRQVMARPRWRAALGDLPERSMSSYPPEVYLSVLSRLGCDVDAWSTTYVHVLHGDNPVLEWVKGTALRPVLTRLSIDDATVFCEELGELLSASSVPTRGAPRSPSNGSSWSRTAAPFGERPFSRKPLQGCLSSYSLPSE